MLIYIACKYDIDWKYDYLFSMTYNSHAVLYLFCVDLQTPFSLQKGTVPESRIMLFFHPAADTSMSKFLEAFENCRCRVQTITNYYIAR